MVASVIFTPTGGSQSVVSAQNGVVTIDNSGKISGAAFYTGLPVPDASQATTVSVIVDNNSVVTASNWTIGTASESAAVTVSGGGSLSLVNSVPITRGSKIIIGNGGTVVLVGYATTTTGLI